LDARLILDLPEEKEDVTATHASSASSSAEIRRRLATAAAVAATIIAAALSVGTAGAAHHPPVDCKAQPRAHLALTRSYGFVLLIGPVENMYMPYQVRASRPKHGEVMLRGQMVMPTHGPLHHLEVHICRRASRVVVTNANPTIVLVDNTKHGHPQKLPVAVMQAIGAGRADLHYGNNVAMPHHHRYTITVALNGERAVLHVASP
jgi:hypothetical protein